MKLLSIWFGDNQPTRDLRSVTEHIIINDSNEAEYVKLMPEKVKEFYLNIKDVVFKSDVLRCFALTIHKDFWYADWDCEIFKDLNSVNELTLSKQHDIFIMGGDTRELLDTFIDYYLDEDVPSNFKHTYGSLYFFIDYKFADKVKTLVGDEYKHTEF